MFLVSIYRTKHQSSKVWWLSLLAATLLYAAIFLYFVKMGGFGQALSQNAHSVLPYPQLPPQEQADFQRAREVLAERTRLLQSLRRQQQARLLMRRWRAVHRMLVCVALGAIGLHLGWVALHVWGTRFHLLGTQCRCCCAN